MQGAPSVTCTNDSLVLNEDPKQSKRSPSKLRMSHRDAGDDGKLVSDNSKILTMKVAYIAA